MRIKTKNKINDPKNRRFWAGVPPWIFICAVAILFPIFAFLTAENINRQKKNSIRLLREKGAALIRSFEAGTRTGMLGTHWKSFQLQKLLTETAQQPDIVHLIVTDAKGTILAHNNPGRISGVHGRDLDLKKISDLSTEQWRLVSERNGRKVFEVFRRFSPTGPMAGMHHRSMMHNFLFRPRLDGRTRVVPTSPIIFVGLDMTSIEEARKADTRHSVIMAAILLLVGFAGIFLLLLAQSYRSTRASLSRIRAFSDNLVENMPIGLLAVDGDKNIASVNPTAESILKISEDSVSGQNARQTLPAELWTLLEALDGEIDVVEREIECPISKGAPVPLDVNASLLHDEDGSFLGYLFLIKDLSEVRALRKEIARTQRLASVGRLAAGVAHEVRNPLSSIKGFATYFKERYRDIPEDQQISTIMIQEVDRLNKVVGQLLDFARPVTVSKKTMAIQPFIRDSLKLVERQAAEKNITVLTRFSSDIDTVSLDPDRMSQVLLNLYLNAVESMDAGGKIIVSTATNAEKKGLEIEIADTGIGIGQEDIAHIFDPYFTTKPSGTGLGLAIANNIMEAHGGNIKVEGRLGQGTTVTLYLPVSETQAA